MFTHETEVNHRVVPFLLETVGNVIGSGDVGRSSHAPANRFCKCWSRYLGRGKIFELFKISILFTIINVGHCKIIIIIIQL